MRFIDLPVIGSNKYKLSSTDQPIDFFSLSAY